MKTFSTLSSLYNSLSQNSATTAVTLGKQIISDQHRYLLQKYFDNERSFQTTTIGPQTLTFTATVAAGDTSATLSQAWPYANCTQTINFSDGEIRPALFTNNSTTVTWVLPLTGVVLWSSSIFPWVSSFFPWLTAISASFTTSGTQAYLIPANVSKIKNSTITIGQLRYVPAPVQSRQEWDLLNFLPYTSDIVNYYFLYQGAVEFWPIPSTTGNVITFNYKTRVPDLSFLDYSTGNITAATVGSSSITGTGTAWSATGNYPLNTDLYFFNLFLRIDPPDGDGIWYQIRQFTSDTVLQLVTPLTNAPNIQATTTYTIGQLPLLSEDFQDMLVYGALKTYFSSIVEKPDKYKLFKDMYDEKMKLLEDYAGTKTVSNVDLGSSPQMVNPNLFAYASQ